MFAQSLGLKAPFYNHFKLHDVDVIVTDEHDILTVHGGCIVMKPDGEQGKAVFEQIVPHFARHGTPDQFVVMHTALYGELTEAELDAALYHELGHIKLNHLSHVPVGTVSTVLSYEIEADDHAALAVNHKAMLGALLKLPRIAIKRAIACDIRTIGQSDKQKKIAENIATAIVICQPKYAYRIACLFFKGLFA